MDKMARALQLAARALGTTSPNPAVGAVLVRDGSVVGEGWTQPPGHDHAEVVALQQAGKRARGAVMYVTLEPCAHQGRTPPCADAIVASGVAQVNIATLDPSPWVNGAGRAVLDAAGIRTTLGTLESEARRLNEGYWTWITRGRPLVSAVYQMGLDGLMIEPAAGWMLDEAARRELEQLKTRADRALVGLGSLRSHDPDLTGLGREGVTSLVVQCGARDLRRLLDQGLADKLVAFVTPRVRAGQTIAGATSATARPATVRNLSYERFGADLLIVGYTGTCSPVW